MLFASGSAIGAEEKNESDVPSSQAIMDMNLDSHYERSTFGNYSVIMGILEESPITSAQNHGHALFQKAQK